VIVPGAGLPERSGALPAVCCGRSCAPYVALRADLVIFFAAAGMLAMFFSSRVLQRVLGCGQDHRASFHALQRLDGDPVRAVGELPERVTAAAASPSGVLAVVGCGLDGSPRKDTKAPTEGQS